MVYLPTFTITIIQLWVNIPCMDDMGLFVKGVFFTDSTMVNHHYTTTIWGNLFFVFRKHLKQIQEIVQYLFILFEP